MLSYKISQYIQTCILNWELMHNLSYNFFNKNVQFISAEIYLKAQIYLTILWYSLFFYYLNNCFLWLLIYFLNTLSVTSVSWELTVNPLPSININGGAIYYDLNLRYFYLPDSYLNECSLKIDPLYSYSLFSTSVDICEETYLLPFKRSNLHFMLK